MDMVAIIYIVAVGDVINLLFVDGNAAIYIEKIAAFVPNLYDLIDTKSLELC